MVERREAIGGHQGEPVAFPIGVADLALVPLTQRAELRLTQGVGELLL